MEKLQLHLMLAVQQSCAYKAPKIHMHDQGNRHPHFPSWEVSHKQAETRNIVPARIYKMIPSAFY